MSFDLKTCRTATVATLKSGNIGWNTSSLLGFAPIVKPGFFAAADASPDSQRCPTTRGGRVACRGDRLVRVGMGFLCPLLASLRSFDSELVDCAVNLPCKYLTSSCRFISSTLHSRSVAELDIELLFAPPTPCGVASGRVCPSLSRPEAVNDQKDVFQPRLRPRKAETKLGMAPLSG